MFPIALDVTRIPVLLAGNGELIVRRLGYLDEAKAANVTVFSENPSEELRKAAGVRLVDRLPQQQDLDNYSVILVAGLPREKAEEIVLWARSIGRLVNVEDVNDLCDFFFTANVRRGDLVIAVSTSGASPTLARKARDWLAAFFGSEWAGRVQELSAMRKQLKAQGASMGEIMQKTEKHIADKNWLPELQPEAHKEEAA